MDWQDGTYNVSLDGPTHVTSSNLAPDSNDEVTMAGPTQNGKYLLICTFNGTALFISNSYTDTLAYTFSAQHSLGSTQLFANPTTLVAKQSLNFYIVFHAAPGLPTPTGQFQIMIGQYYTQAYWIRSAGDFLLHLNALPSLIGVSEISIRYWGDIYYDEATLNFPLTNPPIPGGGGSGGSGSGNNPQPTATADGVAGGTASAKATSTADATPTVEATSPAGAAGGAALAKPTASGDNQRTLAARLARPADPCWPRCRWRRCLLSAPFQTIASWRWWPDTEHVTCPITITSAVTGCHYACYAT
ncbi:MAG: hypothetical protein ACHQ4H_14620 [Ktedonobacterales bacterium]